MGLEADKPRQPAIRKQRTLWRGDKAALDFGEWLAEHCLSARNCSGCFAN